MEFIHSAAMGPILQVIIYIVAFLIGAFVYSYLYHIIKRLPKKEKLIVTQECCDQCGHVWKTRETIPIISWIKSRGRCNYCFEKVLPRRFLLELLGGILSVLIILQYGLSLAALTVFFVYGVLTVIAFIDADTHEIPLVLNLILVGLGIVSIFTMPGISLLERGIGIVCVAVPMLIVILIVPAGFGGGDIKMMAAVGILLGWKACVVAFLMGLALGAIYAVVQLIRKKMDKKTKFAFGPALSIGIAVSLYGGLGTWLMSQYMNLIFQIATRR